MILSFAPISAQPEALRQCLPVSAQFPCSVRDPPCQAVVENTEITLCEALGTMYASMTVLLLLIDRGVRQV